MKQMREFSDYDKELFKYYLECIFMEGSKVLLFLFFFWKIGFIKEFFVALFVLMLLRINGGGLHLKCYLSCFAVSFLVLYASILIPTLIHLSIISSGSILLLCEYITYRLVPIVSDNRPEPSMDLILKSKRNTVIIISTYILLLCIFHRNSYLNIGVWVIIIHTLQLLLAKFLKRRGKK